MIEGQTEEAVWVPYYAMRLTVISSFKAKIAVAAPQSPADGDALPVSSFFFLPFPFLFFLRCCRSVA
jgi:hypothetical protein